MAATAAHHDPVTTIILTGPLRTKFGRTHRRQLDTGKGWEAFKSLNYTLDGFEEEIKRLARLGMRFAVFRNGENVGVESLDIGGTRELKIAPVLAGSKRGGILQSVLGAVLLVASIWFPALAGPGVALLAGGVIQLLSPQASGLRQSAAPENLPSYAFGSAKNTTASGNPVPICIGRRRWGGAIISASIYAEDKT
ncbi:tail assembly protein [Pseudomonas sp. NFR16]|uniref:tail assembly protein n=1 Tax=Pseudomonas sp. NFR16 TaxID=1566248 RepID=UPI0008D44D36|nr:tail assembly protein [Pseudomonas sp. NFR16]SEJ49298.1 Phage-related protein, tail component [Pseudomonas sp. NFR16]